MVSVTEVWKAIPGHAGYEASNLGRVRSLSRIVEQPLPNGTVRLKRWAGRILKPIEHRGYLVLKLGKCPKIRGVHQYIAWTFIGAQENGLVVNHKNGQKHDNRPDNLEYITNSENVRHAYDTGLLSNTGENNRNAKITREIADKIRSSTCPAADAAKAFGVAKHVIHQIRSGKTWV